MNENGGIYTAGKNFTLPPAVTALTNSTSGDGYYHMTYDPQKEAEIQSSR